VRQVIGGSWVGLFKTHFVLFRDLGHHVDIVQGDIDILKELFKGEGYNLDANALLEVNTIFKYRLQTGPTKNL